MSTSKKDKSPAPAPAARPRVRPRIVPTTPPIDYAAVAKAAESAEIEVASRHVALLAKLKGQEASSLVLTRLLDALLDRMSSNDVAVAVRDALLVNKQEPSPMAQGFALVLTGYGVADT